MTPATTRTTEAERVRAYDTARKRRKRAEGKEIGSIPPIAEPDRRREAARSLRRFCEIYHPERFALDFGPSQLRAIDIIERAILTGGRAAIGMPRGYGKTVYCVCGAEWAILEGLHHYVVPLGATTDDAHKMMTTIKHDFMHNQTLVEDYPAALWPIHALEGETRRANGQRHHGRPTRIKWLDDKIVMPTIPGEPSSGAIVDVAGIMGHIRGRHHVGPNGEIFRPTLAICDDVQTMESAWSQAQTAKRLRILKQDVAGLSEPGRSVTMLLPCTVIQEGDLADTLLDREQSPDWTGIRTKMVHEWPTRRDLWERYAEIRLRSLTKHDDLREATAFYRANRAEMDNGAEVSWDEYYRRDQGEISAIQCAYDLLLEDAEGFYAERQNDPRRPTNTAGLKVLTAKEITKRLHDDAEFIVPPGFDIVTSSIDVQGDVLFWMVNAWRRDDFTGATIAYGTTPPQARRYFTLRDVGKTIMGEHPEMGFEAALYAELTELMTAIAAKRWRSADGLEFGLARGLVDANWQRSTRTVYRACRESRGIWMPSHGRGIRAADTPISQFKAKPGERLGDEWIIRPNRKGRSPIRHVMFDANHHKTAVHAALATPANDPGGLTLYTPDGTDHRMLADHLGAEIAIRNKVEATGREVEEWRLRPSKPDNHWLDTEVMCRVAASIEGAKTTTAAPSRPRRKRVKFSEQARKRRSEQA